MFPPMAFGYILAMLGLFGVPSIIMLMGQNGVVTFPGFAVKGPTDYMNMSGLLYNITGPLRCVNTTITALAGAYLHETSYNITGPMGRLDLSKYLFRFAKYLPPVLEAINLPPYLGLPAPPTCRGGSTYLNGTCIPLWLLDEKFFLSELELEKGLFHTVMKTTFNPIGLVFLAVVLFWTFAGLWSIFASTKDSADLAQLRKDYKELQQAFLGTRQMLQHLEDTLDDRVKSAIAKADRSSSVVPAIPVVKTDNSEAHLQSAQQPSTSSTSATSQKERMLPAARSASSRSSRRTVLQSPSSKPISSSVSSTSKTPVCISPPKTVKSTLAHVHPITGDSNDTGSNMVVGETSKDLGTGAVAGSMTPVGQPQSTSGASSYLPSPPVEPRFPVESQNSLMREIPVGSALGHSATVGSSTPVKPTTPVEPAMPSKPTTLVEPATQTKPTTPDKDSSKVEHHGRSPLPSTPQSSPTSAPSSSSSAASSSLPSLPETSPKTPSTVPSSPPAVPAESRVASLSSGKLSASHASTPPVAFPVPVAQSPPPAAPSPSPSSTPATAPSPPAIPTSPSAASSPAPATPSTEKPLQGGLPGTSGKEANAGVEGTDRPTSRAPSTSPTASHVTSTPASASPAPTPMKFVGLDNHNVKATRDATEKSPENVPIKTDGSLVQEKVSARKNFFLPPAAGVDHSPMSSPATPSPKNLPVPEKSSGCELNQSRWASESASPAPSKAPARPQGKASYPGKAPAAAYQDKRGTKSAKQGQPMPAFLRGTEYEARWNEPQGPPTGMKWMLPPDVPELVSPDESPKAASSAGRTNYFVNPVPSGTAKPRIPAFLDNNNVGSNDPGAAARKQYDGLGGQSKASAVKPSENSNNDVAAPIPLSSPAVKPSENSNNGVAAPILRSPSSLPGLGPKLRLPAFLDNNDVESNDPGAAARKQYGGLGGQSKAPAVKSSENSKNGVAAPIPRSSPAVKPSENSNNGVAAPIPRSSSPQQSGPAKPRIPAFLDTNTGSNDPGAAARKQYGGLGSESKAPAVKPADSSNNDVAAPVPRSSSPQQSGPAKPRIPAFLDTNTGSNDPGAAARKQYGGVSAPAAKPSKSPNNNVAAPIRRSPSPQLPGLGASKWAQQAKPTSIPRSPSPQLPGLGASKWAQPAKPTPIPRSSSPQLPGLGASRWATPAPAQTTEEKPFVQPTLPGRRNNGGGKKGYRKW